MPQKAATTPGIYTAAHLLVDVICNVGSHPADFQTLSAGIDPKISVSAKRRRKRAEEWSNKLTPL